MTESWRQRLYRVFGVKPRFLSSLKRRGLIVSGRVETKITPGGLEQTLHIQPVMPVDHITIHIDTETR